MNPKSSFRGLDRVFFFYVNDLIKHEKKIKKNNQNVDLALMKQS